CSSDLLRSSPAGSPRATLRGSGWRPRSSPSLSLTCWTPPPTSTSGRSVTTHAGSATAASSTRLSCPLSPLPPRSSGSLRTGRRRADDDRHHHRDAHGGHPDLPRLVHRPPRLRLTRLPGAPQHPRQADARSVRGGEVGGADHRPRPLPGVRAPRVLLAR